MLKYKAQWVIHSYKQQEDINFTEIFVTIVQSGFYQIILILCTLLDYEIRYINVVTVFFYSLFAEEIYMELPYGYKEESYVYHLNKTLYNLKQTPCI